jgi:hypothetical protein
MDFQGFSTFTLGGGDEDALFGRFGNSTYGGAWGYMISSAPIDGLFIGWMVPGGLNGQGESDQTTARLAFQYSQFGVGYNIANIGHFRAQYIGGWAGTIDLDGDSTSYFDDVTYTPYAAGPPVVPASVKGGPIDKPARIEFAFALTAIEGLLVDLGAKFYLPVELKSKAGAAALGGSDSDTLEWYKGVDFAIAASYSAGDFGIGFRYDLQGLGNYSMRLKGNWAPDENKATGTSTSTIRLVPTYNIGDVTIGLDFGWKISGGATKGNGDTIVSGSTQLGFGAFVKKGLGNGDFVIGVAYKTNTYTISDDSNNGKAQGSSVFSVPIILSYAFF